jgi:hypothetical protein
MGSSRRIEDCRLMHQSMLVAARAANFLNSDRQGRQYMTRLGRFPRLKAKGRIFRSGLSKLPSDHC